jgi:hypothetical protein
MSMGYHQGGSSQAFGQVNQMDQQQMLLMNLDQQQYFQNEMLYNLQAFNPMNPVNGSTSNRSDGSHHMIAHNPMMGRGDKGSTHGSNFDNTSMEDFNPLR